MTTIVFKNGVLAGDTLISCDTVTGEMTKIAKCENFVGGGSGNVVDVSKFLDWVEKGADFEALPKFSDSFRGMLIDKNYALRWVYMEGVSRPVEAPFFAVGSGQEVAKGAFITGATAEEAVQAAIHIDPYTGGHVDVLRFK